MMIYRKHKSGAREVFVIALYEDTHPGSKVATCNGCGRSWDDGCASGVTPAPSARCPFESAHKSEKVSKVRACVSVPPLTPRQIATTLAALRYWQRMNGNTKHRPEEDIATDGGTLEPLSDDEIEVLCERINR